MSQKVISYLEECQTKNVGTVPLAEILGKIIELYRRKEYHQLTGWLEQLAQQPQMREGTNMLDFYNNCIVDFEKHLNQLRLVNIVMVAISQITDADAALSFLDTLIEKTPLENHPAANLTLRSIRADALVAKGDTASAKTFIEQIESDLLPRISIETSVYACFYRMKCNYHKRMNELTAYYESGFHYLAYQPLENIPFPDQQELAYNLGIATLVEERLLNFGELLLHPVVKSLENDYKWMTELLQVYFDGDIDGYERVTEQYKDCLNKVAPLAANVTRLREKISIMALVMFTFHQPAGASRLSFQDVATATKLNISAVELLLMKAMSLDLVKGSIDQVDQIVVINWVQPRHLDMKQIKALKGRLADWADRVEATSQFLESHTVGLAV